MRQIILALVVTAVIMAGGILAGVSQYASSRHVLLHDAETRASRFDTVYREASEARLQSLRLGAEIIARDTLIVGALTQRDRAELARRSVPLFEQVLKPRFGVTILGFQVTADVNFFRAHRPDLFGDSLADRVMVAAVMKSRLPVAGLEIGRIGPELRVIAPVISGETYVGNLELGSSPWDALQIAAQATGLDFGFALDRRTAETLDRARGTTDLTKGEVLYIRFSRPEARDLLAAAPFNPAETVPSASRGETREVFVRTIPILDVSRQPVIHITVAEDLTDALAEARRGIVLYTGLATAILLAVVLVGLFQFRALRARLERSFSGRLQEVRSKARAYDRISQSLHDLDAWKLGLLTELVLLIRDPLTAVQGAIDTAVRGTREVSEPALVFAASELRRLNTAVEDQSTMLLMRDRLKRAEPGSVDLAALVTEIAGEAGGAPAIQLTVPAGLPPARCNASLMRAALRTIVFTLQRRMVGSSIVVALKLEDGAIVGRVAGSGGWRASPPSLDELVAFGTATEEEAGSLLILARLTLERFDGSLTILEGETNRVGFLFSLKAA
ncbi:cache domain-containing protein [Methylobacterium planeticum]|uniref:cache domain-containing protein n=1 Tax=Methylobacterium planeticum TaxID=2615211 RepID=UPI001FEEF88D|nr:cache domain-containing protein [Methylobacterium planeticum]